MAEIDYQMALLLQYKFEQEHKRKESTDSDLRLALELQEQFKAEVEVEKPSNNLAYKAPAASGSKCLVDPSWEVIDPTPDVHVLFMAFNQKFFWNSLGSVTVSWSKRMTTCAGICSYQGRGGMCSITLSEPLLKLRPRKDLVETLLHEMIHAYLFVTNNNRDRDGHGPEFHKHMNRINAEAGTNITVYHDFHDEVRLYQQHWWRCDGPCQNRKPYFGMVRRATNRAPGPNDRWWSEHTRNCGGTFIKVKSPENPVKGTTAKKKEVPQVNPKNDIRKYITSAKKINSPVSNQSNKAEPTNPSVIVKSNTTTTPLTKNIRTISNNTSSSPQVTNVIPSKTSNIFGFKNLNGAINTKKPGGGAKGAVKNAGSSTFVVTNKGSKTTTSTDTKNATDNPGTSNTEIKPFSGNGRSLSTSDSSSNNRDYSVVRNHWLKKFDNVSQNGLKRPSNSGSCSSPPKLPRICDNVDQTEVECPVCQRKLKPEDLNDHLDNCLETSSNNNEKCIICGITVPSTILEKHVTDCTAKHFTDNLAAEDVFDSIMTCHICLVKFDPKSDPRHIQNCLLTNTVDLTKCNNKDGSKDCPVCKKNLSSKEYDIHVERCMLTMFDEFDRKYDSVQTTKTSCLACGKEIVKSELDSHLEDCMSMSNVFDTSNVPIEDDEETCDDKNKKPIEDSYNCPFCLELVLENDMQVHLNDCLNASNVDDRNAKEKRSIIDSLINSDFDSD